MKIAIINIFLFLVIGKSADKSLILTNEEQFEFSIETNQIEDSGINMFYALLDKDMVSMGCDQNGAIDFEDQILPLDILSYYENKQDEDYYTLLTKTVYSIDQDVTFFTKDRLSDINYLQKIMPYNKLSKINDDFYLEVGFGAPDISYTLDFFANDELNRQYPDLVNYFKKYDRLDIEPHLCVLQHNHTFGKVLGQKTTKMSVSITRYFEIENSRTLVVNYTLNYIYNLPPSLIGGGNYLINQIKEGAVALVRETRKVCCE